jgi:hypothetical protein
MAKKLKYRPSIFRRAAKHIENGGQNFCCNALEWVDASNDEMNLFAKLYLKENPKHGSWFGMAHEYYLPQNRKNRIRALLRTARVAERENAKGKRCLEFDIVKEIEVPDEPVKPRNFDVYRDL